MPKQSVIRAIVLPLCGFAVFVVALMQFGRIPMLDGSLPAAEGLNVERVQVSDHEFELQVRAQGPDGVLIAQVMVDGAYWLFTQAPEGRLGHGERATIRVPFPWVAGETHHFRFVTTTGATFDHSLDVTAKTPRMSPSLLVHYGLLGILIGLIPVAIGILFRGAIARLGDHGIAFLLALTIGLLAYLFFDMLLEGFELADGASDVFGGRLLVLIPLVLTVATLLATSAQTDHARSSVELAALIAMAIGVHNFGEGLAVGAAFAHNEITLGAFLIVGFALHNVTEGIGIVAPLSKQAVAWPILLGLAAVAGLPAVPGIWIGALAFSPHFAAIFFGIGAGAVVQVIFEIDRHLQRSSIGSRSKSRFNPTSVAGYASGALVMYATALLITI